MFNQSNGIDIMAHNAKWLLIAWGWTHHAHTQSCKHTHIATNIVEKSNFKKPLVPWPQAGT